MSAGTTTVDQSGFWGQLRLCNQRLTREGRKPDCPRLVTGNGPRSLTRRAGEKVRPHHQLRNRAGGLYSPPDQATRSSILLAASRERFASRRRTPTSSGYATTPFFRSASVSEATAFKPTGLTPATAARARRRSS